jgi:hypothetical protein
MAKKGCMEVYQRQKEALQEHFQKSANNDEET